MDVLQKQNRFILYISILCNVPMSIAAWLFFDIKSFLGTWTGVALGLIGYHMIVAMAVSLNQEEDSKAKGRNSYIVRYAFYGIVLAVMTMLGIPTLSMLAGFMIHKASLLIYASKERKDFHGRTGKRYRDLHR